MKNIVIKCKKYNGRFTFLCLLFSFFTSIVYSCNNVEKRDFKRDSIIVITNNKLQLNLRVYTNENYLNINDFERFSNKPKDTLKLPINGYGYVYFSTNRTYGDTALVMAGDTLNLVVNENNIVKNLMFQDSSLNSALGKIESFKKNEEYISLRKEIETLTKLFYKIDSNGTPLEGRNDYQKFKQYPLKVNRKALPAYAAQLNLLLSDLKIKYNMMLGFLNNNKSEIPTLLYDVFFYHEQITYYKQLGLLYQILGDKQTLLSINDRIFINEGIIKSPYAKEILNSFIIRNVIKKKADFSRSRVYLDYKEAYDNSPNYFKNDLLKYVRFLSLENMVEYREPKEDLMKFYLDFKNKYKDENLNGILEKKYSFGNAKQANVVNDVEMIDKYSKAHSLTQILAENKGRVIYIDFWASWCAPCRDAMPSYSNLSKEFKSKPVMFLYLSIDTDVGKWKHAVDIEKLDDNSYLILNKDNAKFLKDINLTVIPRYLLYDKNGKLVHQDAPGPSGTTLTNLINKYL